jgi:hypothetical protein
MALEIAPGILYLLRFSPRLLLPPTIIYLLHYAPSSYILTYLGQTSVIPDLSFDLLPFKASSHLAIAMIASVPLALAASIIWEQVKIRYEAKRLGAVLPPRRRDWWPAGVGSLIRQVKEIKSGYLGEYSFLYQGAR